MRTPAMRCTAVGLILHRRDAATLMGVMHAKGHPDRDIAAALNERFAPLLDGGLITKGMVGGHRQRRDAVRRLARKLQMQLLMRQDLTKAEALEQVESR